MGTLGGLIILLQVICAVHALRSGRGGQWIWIIVFVPLVGCVVYFVVEVLPGLRGSQAVRRVGADLVSIIDPGRNLRELEEAVEISDTVKNRQMLARGYVAAKRYPEAVGQYERCLQGVFKDDACTMLELAYVHFLNHDYGQAKAVHRAVEGPAPRLPARRAEPAHRPHPGRVGRYRRRAGGIRGHGADFLGRGDPLPLRDALGAGRPGGKGPADLSGDRRSCPPFASLLSPRPEALDRYGPAATVTISNPKSQIQNPKWTIPSTTTR